MSAAEPHARTYARHLPLEEIGAVMPTKFRPTFLLAPKFHGCSWINSADQYMSGFCKSPVRFVLICAYGGLPAYGCVDHTAQLRAEHPEWISSVSPYDDPSKETR